MSDSSARPTIFCSHRSTDGPRVERIARRIREAGADAWLDRWSEAELTDGVVAKLQDALQRCDVGLLFFSENTPDLGSPEGRWVQAEIEFFIKAAIEGRKRVVVLRLDEGLTLPPFLETRPSFAANQLDELLELILGHRADPPIGKPTLRRVERVRIVLRTDGDAVLLDAEHDAPLVTGHRVTLAERFHRSLRDFLEHTPPGSRYSEAERVRSTELRLVELGRAVGEALLPGPVAGRIAELIERVAADHALLEVCFASADARLLDYPFEALRLADERVLALEPRLRLVRQLLPRDGEEALLRPAPAPAPLKILVAVGAPDEGSTLNSVLDSEAELQTILDALDVANRGDQRAEARILEVGSLDQIREELRRERYHVLHLSGHGRAGILELEDEDGRAVPVTPADVAEVIREAQHPVPLVFLAACHSARGDAEAGNIGFAEGLLREGVPQVIAMQVAVSDHYATELAGAFYRALAEAVTPRASDALAIARRDIERERRKQREAGRSTLDLQPEFATATLFQRGPERPLVDRLATLEPLRAVIRELPPGEVPMLRIGDLVDRRVEVRRAVRTLAEPTSGFVGVQLTGIGGIGKSSIAGRVMQRLADSGWAVASVSGAWTVGELATRLGDGLALAKAPGIKSLGEALATRDRSDQEALRDLRRALANHRVLLVLDNFEDLLADAGARFADEATGLTVRRLLQSVAHDGKGRLLFTSRYPLPGMSGLLEEIEVPPLSTAQTGKLLRRLGALRTREAEDLRIVLRTIGGHPRMLEFVDAILRERGGARLPRVTIRLRELAQKHAVRLDAGSRTLTGAMDTALALGAGDVLLDELLALVKEEEVALERLYEVAVYATPIAAGDLIEAERLAVERSGSPESPADAIPAILLRTSLLSRIDHGYFVHRWTAELLKRRDPERFRACALRAARFMWWRVEQRRGSFEAAVESARLYLTAGAFEEGMEIGLNLLIFLRNRGQMIGVAQLAHELGGALPVEHFDYPALLREEADALRALGVDGKPLHLYLEALRIGEERLIHEPGCADYLRDLSVTQERLGDVMRALGRGEQARAFYEQGLEIAERLVSQEPDQADHLRDLSISLERLGDLMGSLGEAEQARTFYERALKVRERLVHQEPDQPDCHRDLSVSFNKTGDRMLALGRGEQARAFYERALEIAERLVRQEPDRADYLRDLSVCHDRMGDLMRALGDGEHARVFYDQALEIAGRLVRQEPDRADYLRDASVSFNKVGDLMLSLGQAEQALSFYQNALEVRKRLLRQEPDRADHLRDLSLSLNKLGDVMLSLGQRQEARSVFQRALELRERLVCQEPDRADHLRDLSISYERLGDLIRGFGEEDQARTFYEKVLQVREQLVRQEPDRVDYLRDLASSLERIASVVEGAEARATLQGAVDIRRSSRSRMPDHAIVQRELAVTLCQYAQRAEDPAALVEAAALFGDLLARGALEAQYVPLAKALIRQFGTSSSADGPPE